MCGRRRRRDDVHAGRFDPSRVQNGATKRMKNNVLVSIAAFLIAAFIIGCGGGGGGGGTGGNGGDTSGNTGAVPYQGQYIEFIQNGSKVDPMELSVGETVQCVVANYDPSGTRSVLSARKW